MKGGNDSAVCAFAQAVQQFVVGAYETFGMNGMFHGAHNGNNVPTSNLGRGLATFCWDLDMASGGRSSERGRGLRASREGEDNKSDPER